MDLISLKFAMMLVVVAFLFFLNKRIQWFVLLGASFVFFSESTGLSLFLAIIFAVIAINYLTAKINDTETNITLRKITFSFTLLLTLFPLIFSKIFYHNFFDIRLNHAVVNSAFGLLPIGLSFITFTLMSYQIDSYKKKIPSEKNFLIFLLYILYFPKLLAGPIERAGDLIQQFKQKLTFEESRITSGLKLILWGLFKKVAIAGLLGLFVNPVYGNLQAYNGAEIAIATVFFAFQIYYDFSAYTDIAIGISRIFGIKLSPNFNSPYTAKSIPEFWRRWHMTLSSWTRDYIYIPLGGSKHGVLRMCISITTVFLVIGLWHGFASTFVAWGLLNGAYMIFFITTGNLRASIAKKIGLSKHTRIEAAISIAFTFILINAAWILFRAKTLSDAFYVFTHLFSGWTIENLQYVFGIKELGIALAAIILTELIQAKQGINLFSEKPIWIRWPLYLAAVWIILGILLTQNGADNFIYQRF